MTRERGFTLIELILALTLVAALLAIAFGALRVGVGAWRRGEDRAEIQQHARSLVHVLTRTLGGAYAYRAEKERGEEPELLFDGHPDRIALVTTAPTFAGDVPVAFTALIVSVDGGTPPGLAIRQKPLPNFDPFEEGPPAIVDPAVVTLGLRYLRDVPGSWEERWEGAREDVLPRAIELTFTTTLRGRAVEHGPFVVPLPTAGP